MDLKDILIKINDARDNKPITFNIVINHLERISIIAEYLHDWALYQSARVALECVNCMVDDIGIDKNQPIRDYVVAEQTRQATNN